MTDLFSPSPQSMGVTLLRAGDAPDGFPVGILYDFKELGKKISIKWNGNKIITEQFTAKTNMAVGSSDIMTGSILNQFSTKGAPVDIGVTGNHIHFSFGKGSRYSASVLFVADSEHCAARNYLSLEYEKTNYRKRSFQYFSNNTMVDVETGVATDECWRATDFAGGNGRIDRNLEGKVVKDTRPAMLRLRAAMGKQGWKSLVS